MNLRRLLLLTFALFALFTTGCAKPWKVVLQAQPDPFVGHGRFAVAPTDFTGLRVGEKSEAEYLAGKDEKQQLSFANDKAAANEEFTKALINRAHDEGVEIILATGPTDAPFTIRPAMTFFEPGFYAGVVSFPSRLDVTLKLTTPDGSPLDEILMTHRTAAPTIGLTALLNVDKMSSGGRIRADALWIGQTSGKYLLMRVHND